MLDQPSNPNKGLSDFLGEVKGWIAGGIAFITALVAFAKLLQSDTGLALGSAAACAIAASWLATAYVYRKSMTSNAFGVARTRHAYSDRTRHLSVAGSVAVTILATGGLLGVHYVPTLLIRSSGAVILVATFAGTDAGAGDRYGVTQFILDRLNQAVSQDAPSMRVQSLGHAVSTPAEARAAGSAHGAMIVLWGWYVKTETDVGATIHFEVLQRPRYLQLAQSLESLDMPVVQLQHLSTQKRLAGDASYLTLLTLGLASYEGADYRATIRRLSDALAEHAGPSQVPAYFYRANAYFYTGKYLRARADLDQVIRLVPNNAEAYYNRGLVRWVLKDTHGALADFDQAIHLTPHSVYSLYSRALLRSSQGDQAGAIADFDRVIRLAPNSAGAYLGRGNARYEQADYRGALSDYSRAIQLAPNDPNAYYNRSLVHARLGDDSAARQDRAMAQALQRRKR